MNRICHLLPGSAHLVMERPAAKGEQRARRVVFSLQAQHIGFPVAGLFGIFCVLIMAGAAGKITAGRMAVTHHRAIRDIIAIYIFVATPDPIEFIQIGFPKDFASIHGAFGVFKGPGHPLVHAQVKIRENENRRL